MKDAVSRVENSNRLSLACLVGQDDRRVMN
jgi:hypothetical protein